ncbi:hypothetical protein ND747_04225, partial [Frankia sp. R82]|nr:hypothetical protein [Frankia sp. R82]
RPPIFKLALLGRKVMFFIRDWGEGDHRPPRRDGHRIGGRPATAHGRPPRRAGTPTTAAPAAPGA